MEGPRAPTDREYTSIVNFLDKALRSKSEWSIAKEYPTALTPQNVGNIRIIKDQNEVLSHALLRPLLVKTPVGLFKAGTIGSVVTNSKYRNKGLSQKVLTECLDFAKTAGCDFAILWTSLYEFYRRLGFELAGNEISTVIDKEFEVESTGLRFMEGANVDPAAIHKVYSKHTVTAVRTFEDIGKYLKIPNSRVYTAWNSSNVLMAYAIEGKGADLDGYIHEWGGSVSAILPLLNHIRKVQKRDITLITPFHSQNLVRRLGELGFQQHQGFLGMIKILNFENFFAKIKRHARVDLGIADFDIIQKGDVFHIRLLESEFTVNGEQNLTRIIFGPWLPEDLKALDDMSRRTLGAILPIRMWVWGWDSV